MPHEVTLYKNLYTGTTCHTKRHTHYKSQKYTIVSKKLVTYKKAIQSNSIYIKFRVLDKLKHIG